MFHLKEMIFWLVLAIAVTPLAFLLVPVVILMIIIGGFTMMLQNRHHHA